MKEVRIPAVPVPPRIAMKIGQDFRGIGDGLVRLHPNLERRLHQARMEMNPAEYMGLAFFSASFYGVLSAVLVTALAFDSGASLLIGPGIGVILFIMTFGFISAYPSIVVMRIAKATDKQMLAAMRHLLIEVRSGVPLYNGMIGITQGYGQVSEEFKEIVRDINAGAKQMEALNSAAERNTSLFFRRALWQLVNAMQAGGDIGDTMEAITDSFAKKQATQIRKYGQEMNPWTMIYMIMAVIVPSLGITFLIVLSSFTGIPIPPLIFPLILVVLILFQVFFIGFVKNKRPNVTV